MWLIYNILFSAAFLCMLPYYLMRMKRRGGYRAHFWQRLARYEPELMKAFGDRERIWVHAVSVGEVYVGLKVMDELRRRDPDTRFVLSVTTSTAHTIAELRLGEEDALIYFPVDLPLVMRRAVKILKPKALVLIECEFWPNLLRLAHRRKIPVALVNGRVSDSSYRGYQKLRIFTKPIMKLMNPVCVQSALDRERLISLGCPAERVHDLGSAKYEVAQANVTKEREVREALRSAGIAEDHPVLLGGSTWSGEEAVLLNIYKELREEFPGLALVLAPRHMERRDEVIKEIEAQGLSVRLRSIKEESDEKKDVFLIDTTGELRFFYASADVIFIGKSLTQDGGQNPIEAALYGKPVLVGPNMQNFPVVMRDFRAADALIQVKDAEELKAQVRALLADKGARIQLGARASALVETKRGAIKTTVDLIQKVLP